MKNTALKAALAVICLIGCLSWGTSAFLYQSSFGLAACWVGAMASGLAAGHFVRISLNHIERY